MALFGFKPKTDEVLDHWICFVDGASLSSQLFYDAVEKELANRQIPGLAVSQIEYSEGGVLSNKRIYLRLLRERLAFDACAAPFGKIFFFSCRCVYSPAVLRLWHIVVALLFFYLVYSLLLHFLGFFFANVAISTLLLAILETFRNAYIFNLGDLDTILMKIPVFGPIYERVFRKETYFREDTRLLYLNLVKKLIKDIMEEMTGQKGLKLEQYERTPILGELYKPIAPKNP